MPVTPCVAPGLRLACHSMCGTRSTACLSLHVWHQVYGLPVTPCVAPGLRLACHSMCGTRSTACLSLHVWHQVYGLPVTPCVAPGLRLACHTPTPGAIRLVSVMQGVTVVAQPDKTGMRILRIFPVFFFLSSQCRDFEWAHINYT